jgi:hypothetical protein
LGLSRIDVAQLNIAQLPGCCVKQPVLKEPHVLHVHDSFAEVAQNQNVVGVHRLRYAG